MKWDKELRKRITGKKCVSKKEKLNGTVVYSSTYLVQVKFDNGAVKNYAYTQFLNEFDIISQKQIATIKEKEKIPFSKVYANKVITDYLNKQYPTYTIEFRLYKKDIHKVFIDGAFCGYLQISNKFIKISYFIRMPNPLLAKYQCRWWGRPKLNLNYEFVDLTDKTDLYICLNELIYAHTQDMDKFVNETRENNQIATIK